MREEYSVCGWHATEEPPKLFYLSGYDKCMKWSRVDIHPLNMPSGYQTPLSILHYGQWFLLVRLPNSEDGRQQFIAFKR
jgi:hypothetical protein